MMGLLHRLRSRRNATFTRASAPDAPTRTLPGNDAIGELLRHSHDLTTPEVLFGIL